jgi:hypothetical protein
MLKNRLLNIICSWIGGLVLFIILTTALRVQPAASQSQLVNGADASAVPSIQFTKTVGLDPTECALTDSIDVLGPTTVVYCYAVKNTGDVTLTRNTLSEEGIGPLLNDIYLVLGPGDYTFFTATALIQQTAVTTASWDAYDINDYIVTDTAPYNFIDISGFGEIVPISTNGWEEVATPDSFDIQVYSGYNHHFRIDMNGVIRMLPTEGVASPTNQPLPVTVSRYFKYAAVPFWDDLDNDTGNVFHAFTGTAPNRTWIVQWNNIPHFNNFGNVTFQVQMQEKVGDISFHYADVGFGNPDWNSGKSATIGLQKNITSAVQYSFNTASITNGMAISFTPTFITATDSHSAVVNFTPIEPDIVMTKTVGTAPGLCATTTTIVLPIGGGDVYYCYTIRNTGNYTLTRHDLSDDKLGGIMAGTVYTLAPGQSIDTVSAGITASAFITQDTVNIGSWTAYNPGPANSASTTAVATVTVTPPPIWRIYLPAVRNATGTTTAVHPLWLIPLIILPIPALVLLARQRNLSIYKTKDGHG